MLSVDVLIYTVMKVMTRKAVIKVFHVIFDKTVSKDDRWDTLMLMRFCSLDKCYFKSKLLKISLRARQR